MSVRYGAVEARFVFEHVAMPALLFERRVTAGVLAANVRGQLSVYLRATGARVPPIYG